MEKKKGGRPETVIDRKAAYEAKIEKQRLDAELKESLPTIFDKHRKYILMARDGYLRGWKMSDMEEILAFIEEKTKQKRNVNFNCSYCVIDLINSFSYLENYDSKTGTKKVR